jgi:hypothetical protein
MRNYLRIIAATLFTLTIASVSFADVKIKTKQTMSGQSYENTTYIKGKRSRSETMGGAMINIVQCDLRRGVQINPSARTYMINEFVQAIQNGGQTQPASNQNGVVRAGGTVSTTISTKDTGERKQMFGYVAKHLIITMETVSSPDACSPTNSKMQMDGWYIDAEFVLDCDYGQSYGANQYGKKGGCQDKYEMKQVGTAVKRGYPVYEKMTMFDQSGKETYSMVNEVIELSKATLEAGLFDIPSDYRQVTNASQLYTAAAVSSSSSSSSSSSLSSMSYPSSSVSSQTDSGLSQSIRNSNSSDNTEQPVSAKKPGTIRIGLAAVKTGAVGDGITAGDLAAAIRNSLAEYLKVPNVEVVNLDAKLASAIDAEAKEKECDYVVYVNVSHKKGGGGGFGSMFGQALGATVGRVGIGQTGSTVGNIAGQIATQSIVSAATVSSTMKAKDEITLDLRLNKAGADVLAKQFKAKAKSNGDDIISQIVEQAAQAIVTAVGS